MQAGKVATAGTPTVAGTAKLLKQYGCGPIEFSGTDNALFERHLLFDNVVKAAAAGDRERFEAAARSVRDVLSWCRWVLTENTYERENPKRVYYLSMEFLIGRSLANNVMNLLVSPLVEQTVARNSLDWLSMLEREPDAGLGNGGLGRLAACFLDSMATMQLPAMGYGLRYEYGMFRQTIEAGWQREQPDNWLRFPDPWEVARPHDYVEVKLNCSVEIRGGRLQFVAGHPSTLIGMPFDRPVVGYGGMTVNTLRLWAAAAPDYFDFGKFSSGDFVGALAETLAAESLTRVLYPDDSTSQGQELRFVQEYFLVACSLADIIRRFRRSNADWNTLPEKIAIQLNDTHPSMAVPELMRILLDDVHLGWDQAWGLTQRSLAYTNHTLLPEALEKWPVAWFEMLLPRHLEIIFEINRRLLDTARQRFPGEQDRVARVSLIEEGSGKHVRMANLAIVGSHSTNGVAAIHSQLLRTVTVKDLAEMFPERFSNKTNGVTPRRWLLLANPALAREITEAIGDSWITDLDQLKGLKPLAGDGNFRDQFHKAKREAKSQFAQWLKTRSARPSTQARYSIAKSSASTSTSDSFSMPCALLCSTIGCGRTRSSNCRRGHLFSEARRRPPTIWPKSSSSSSIAWANTINSDPAVRGRIKVLFLSEYEVTLAERLLPASDVSNQISTAGYEASGTSNMKFMMNGAMTVGTRDGATIEMAQQAGEENFFLFGLTAEQVANSRSWYDPHWHYEHEPETRAALDLICSDHFNRDEPGIFAPLLDTLLHHGDFYMHLADLSSYLDADRRLCELYSTPDAWASKAILNVASSGKFSSDRTITEYAAGIWNAEPCPVS